MVAQPLTKVLVVDDDDDTLVIARYSLKNLKDVEVKYASSGGAAVKEALRFQPDLILLDVMMPDMDGMATLKEIRSLTAISHIPVVFFTAKAQKEEIDSYIQAGVLDVIVKPFDPIHLGEVILKIWNKQQEAPH